MFFNELNMLKYRLAVLNDTVDLFVIVEATHTHSGKPKDLFLRDHFDEFAKYHHKIILDAVIKRDPDAARQAMQNHLQQVREDSN